MKGCRLDRDHPLKEIRLQEATMQPHLTKILEAQTTLYRQLKRMSPTASLTVAS